MKKKSRSTIPTPTSVKPFKILETLARIQKAEKPAGDYSDHEEKSNAEGNDEAFLEQHALKKEQFQVKHRTEDHEGHPRKKGEADESGCDKGIRRAAKRQDHGHCHHCDGG